ncbi:MAG TPA: SDR family NAD(P)-dependent oxidoreductase [Solirubrobacterales bacterium]|nr:SDR family NAD(P)-dependent oxidoreductase [Solirubrobacterales bacterium]
MKTAVVTGASSGIGAATARALAGDGWRLVLGARRLERLEELAAEIGDAKVGRLDVTSPDSVAEFCAAIPECQLLVNNAGGALGLEPVADADEARWLSMYESNALGTMRMTKALLPQLRSSGDGLVVGVTSIAAFETYRGGAGYTAAKHAQRAIMRTLRLELLGEPIRVTEIAPGLTETEFSLVRFGGDEAAAADVYRGTEPLRAPEVAECIRWVAAQPSHVNVDELVLRPRDQARATEIHRREAG